MNTCIFLQVTNGITLLICNFFWLLRRQNPQDNSLNKDKIWYLGVHMNVYFAWYRKNVKFLSNLHCRNMKNYLFSETFMFNLLIFIWLLFILSYFIHETNIYCIPSIFWPLCQMLVISCEQGKCGSCFTL